MAENFASSNNSLFKVLAGVLVLGITGFGVYFFLLSSAEKPNPNGWQAVFLENDQVYFGKLSLTADFYVLENVYYLQTEESTVAGLNNTSSDSINTEEVKQTSTRLVKLGNELHGPEDKMFIEKSKVLFWENLKESSNITRSIESNN